jgi:hypothetical protein
LKSIHTNINCVRVSQQVFDDVQVKPFCPIVVCNGEIVAFDDSLFPYSLYLTLWLFSFRLKLKYVYRLAFNPVRGVVGQI